MQYHNSKPHDQTTVIFVQVVGFDLVREIVCLDHDTNNSVNDLSGRVCEKNNKVL